MKSLIVFFALLILGTSLMIHQAEIGRFVEAQNQLKDLAENAASGAAQFYDSEAYSNGRLVFDQDRAIDCVESILEGYDLEYEIDFFDDQAGYGRLRGIDIVYPAVFVVVKSPKNQITRSALYELTTA